MRKIAAFLALALIAALPAAGQSGNSISVAVSLPGDLGGDLTLSFEEVTGLSLANLDVSAEVINPNDSALRARLPSTLVVPALAILLRIEPPAAGSLSFTGI